MLFSNVCGVVLVLVAVEELANSKSANTIASVATIETDGRLMELQDACWINSHKIPPKAGMEGQTSSGAPHSYDPCLILN